MPHSNKGAGSAAAALVAIRQELVAGATDFRQIVEALARRGFTFDAIVGGTLKAEQHSILEFDPEGKCEDLRRKIRGYLAGRPA